mgnify:CR=1 FL=1
MDNKILYDLLEKFDLQNPTFRPTEIYNEGWLLRILLNEYSKLESRDGLLKFSKGATWYSEAMLPTKFKARPKKEIGHKDTLAESRTNADGVIGHIEVGNKGKADLELAKNAKQFVVIEAKMNSKLSKGISNSKEYNQAARTVACMAETIRLNKEVNLRDIENLAFIVLAPRGKIKDGDFSDEMEIESIKNKVKDRVEEYKGNKNSKYYTEWYYSCFSPLIDKIKIHKLSWETAIEKLPDVSKEKLNQFYQLCFKYN